MLVFEGLARKRKAQYPIHQATRCRTQAQLAWPGRPQPHLLSPYSSRTGEKPAVTVDRVVYSALRPPRDSIRRGVTTLGEEFKVPWRD